MEYIGNFASMYATRSRRVKTDRRDARTLCFLTILCQAPLRVKLRRIQVEFRSTPLSLK